MDEQILKDFYASLQFIKTGFVAFGAECFVVRLKADPSLVVKVFKTRKDRDTAYSNQRILNHLDLAPCALKTLDLSLPCFAETSTCSFWATYYSYVSKYLTPLDHPIDKSYDKFKLAGELKDKLAKIKVYPTDFKLGNLGLNIHDPSSKAYLLDTNMFNIGHLTP